MEFEEWARNKFRKSNVEPPENEKDWVGELEDLMNVDVGCAAFMEGVEIN